ncbi:MAG: hypothetical protein PHS79_03500 [Patescibacteria group bacterium]|nr:hypothetical protein [Patescibacteria group bacterium]
MPETNAFRISYDGSALVTHEMDVKELAPALLAIGELFEEANRILNGENVKIAVNMKAVEAGSIVVGLSVAQTLQSHAINLFSGSTTTAIVNGYNLMQILGIVGTTGGGLIGLIKWLKNRPIKNITKLDTGEAEIEVEDGEIRIATMKEIKLFGILNIRKSVEAFVKPLERAGVDKMSFVDDGSHQVITKEEVPYFKAPIIDEELMGETISEKSLQIISPTFQEGGKWKFSDGTASFFADILDYEFIEKVQKNEIAFAKDDLLTVQLKTKQSLANGQIKADHSIIKILKHRSAAVQIKLPFSDSENGF